MFCAKIIGSAKFEPGKVQEGCLVKLHGSDIKILVRWGRPDSFTSLFTSTIDLVLVKFTSILC